MRIGLKLTIAFLSIASFVGIAGYLAHGTTRQVERQMDRLSRSSLRKVADTNQIITALYGDQLAAHAQLISARKQLGRSRQQAERHGLLEQHRTTIETALTRQIQVAESMVHWAEEQNLTPEGHTQALETLREFDRQFDRHLELEDEFLGLAQHDPDQAEIFLETKLCEHFETQLLPLLEAYQQDAENELTQSVRATERAMAVADQQRGLLILAAAASSVLMGLFTSRSIGKPLAALQRAADDIGKGRFDIRVPASTHDELGLLTQSIQRMAAELQQTTVSKSYLDNIIQSMREMLIVVGPDLRIVRVNQATCSELKYSEDDLIGLELKKLFVPDSLGNRECLLASLLAGSEYFMRTKTKQEFPAHCSAAAMDVASDEEQGYVCIASNISSQKEAEYQLVASLRQKELLLKEVHHRVKNNLQVISSLLSLQAKALKDPEIARLFEESQGRIRSMALIHEQLYHSDDLAQIDFAVYVRDLVRHLERGLGDQSASVHFHLAVEPLLLSLDSAIACGMIVNELVSNAQKHAFPNQHDGEIHVEFTRRSGEYCLTVADNGVGLQKEMAASADSSLGLRVVQALTTQIHGDLDVRYEAGTRFTIRFQSEKDAES